MGNNWVLSGRQRTIKKTVTFSVQGKLNFSSGGTNINYWFVDFSACGFTSGTPDLFAIKPGIRNVTYFTFRDAALNYLYTEYEFEYGVYYGSTFILMGTRRTGHAFETAPPGTAFSDPSVWEQLSWSASGTRTIQGVLSEGFTDYGDFVEHIPPGESADEVTVIQGQTFTRSIAAVSPGTDWRNRPTTTDLQAYSAFTAAGGVAAHYAKSSNAYAGTPAPGVSQASIDDFNANSTLYAAGCSATWNATYDNTGGANPGLNSPPGGWSVSNGGGSVSWATSTATAPSDHTSQNTAQGIPGGTSQQTLVMNMALRRLKVLETVTQELRLLAGPVPLAVNAGDPVIARTMTAGAHTYSRVRYGYTLQGIVTQGATNVNQTLTNIPAGAGNSAFLHMAVRFVDEVGTDMTAPSSLTAEARYFAAYPTIGLTGQGFDAIRLDRVAAADIEASPFTIGGATGWAGSGVTVTETGGKLRAVVGGSVGGMQRINGVTSGALLGWRYLTFRIRSVGSANKTMSVTFGQLQNRVLTTGADGVWVELALDIFSPLPSQWQGTFPASTPLSMAFSNMSVSTTFEIDFVRGSATKPSIVTVLSPFNFAGTFTGQSVGGLHAFTDGILSLNTNLWRTTGNSRTIAQVAASVNALNAVAIKNFTGWTATDLAPRGSGVALPVTAVTIPLSDWLHSDRESWWLEGSGVRRDNTTFLDKEATGDTLTMKAFPVWFSVAVYPGAGDVMSGTGAYNSTTTIDFKGMIGAQAAATLIGDESSPDIEARDYATNALRGVGVAANGWAATQEPFIESRTGTGVVPVTAVALADNSGELRYRGNAGVNGLVFTGSPIYTYRRYFERRERFFTGWILASAFWQSVDTAGDGRFLRVGASGTSLKMEAALNPDGQTWGRRKTIAIGARPQVKIDRGDTQKAFIVYENTTAASIEVTGTQDEGTTLDVATTINTSGTRPAFCISPMQTQHHFWRATSGAIEGKIFDNFGSQIYPTSGVITVVGSVVADEIITAWYAPESSRIFVQYRTTANTTLTAVSTDGGKTFA